MIKETYKSNPRSNTLTAICVVVLMTIVGIFTYNISLTFGLTYGDMSKFELIVCITAVRIAMSLLGSFILILLSMPSSLIIFGIIYPLMYNKNYNGPVEHYQVLMFGTYDLIDSFTTRWFGDVHYVDENGKKVVKEALWKKAEQALKDECTCSGPSSVSNDGYNRCSKCGKTFNDQ